jgi:anti-sigma regulatory factor (Ser/Thr protein kinase)
LAVAVANASQVGEARRLASALAEQSGFDAAGVARVALVVTELASNLAKHAHDGELLIRAIARSLSSGIEILSIDRGPGMADPERCLRDGYSTAGSPGTGLGAVARLSRSLDIFSTPIAGTALIARIWSGPTTNLSPDELAVSAVCVPKSGETECGDAWATEIIDGGRMVLLLVDGLGHGHGAAEAARLAVNTFRGSVRLGPVEIVRTMHLALRATRGAAVAVAEIDPRTANLRFAGVGNISAAVVHNGNIRRMVSHNGTVGHAVHKVQEFTYSFFRGALMILHTDGLGTRWNLAAYPGLLARDPGLVAGVLYRDFRRGRDDVTVTAVGQGKE